MFREWRKRRNKQKKCFHHEPTIPGEKTYSYLRAELIDTGRRKMFWCTNCDKIWIF